MRCKRMLSRYISINGGGGQPKNMKAKASHSYKMKSVCCPCSATHMQAQLNSFFLLISVPPIYKCMVSKVKKNCSFEFK